MGYDVTKIFQGAPMVKLGELITQRREKNSGLDVPVRGVSREGFINPKQEEADKTKYNVFYKYDFVFNPARMEVNSIALNTSIEQGICSSLYEIFSVDEERILPEFLNLFVKREEFARQCEYIGSGSAREYCRVANISEIEIPLPAIEVQREYVAAYRSLQQLVEQNEALAAPLQDAIQNYIISSIHKYELHPVGKFIEFCREKNSDKEICLEQGVNINKEFITPQRSNSDLSSRIKVRNGQFVYCTQLNNENVAIAYRNGPDCVVSPVYAVFQIANEYNDILLPEFLFMNLIRKEFGRFVYWSSVGSAYEFLRQENLCEWKIPLPPIEVQRSIVALYNCAEEARAIAKEAREQLKILAPAMVQRAANTPVEV